MYKIEKRYQTYLNSGKTWSGWFVVESNLTEDMAKTKLKELKKLYPKQDNGLLNEYRIQP